MARIVFHGDNPYGKGANGKFNKQILNQISDNRIICLCYNAYYANRLFQSDEIHNIISVGTKEDTLGIQELLNFLSSGGYDLFLSNNDIWRMWEIYKQSHLIHEKSGFKWAQVFPCDSDSVKDDWLQILSRVDLPIVYSRHGYELYKPHVPKLRYLKPFVDSEVFKPLEDKDEIKKSLFGSKDLFVVAVIAKNQIRKDIIRTLEIFKVFSEKRGDAILYLHMEANDRFGTNLKDAVIKMGIKDRVAFKKDSLEITTENLNKLYNGVDALLITSLAEGLCFPIIEAQLTGLPVIGSKNTAITELLSDGKGFLIDCNSGHLTLPMWERGGVTHDPRMRANIEQGVDYLNMIADKKYPNSIIENARLNALTYGDKKSIRGILQPLIESIVEKKKVIPKRKEKILFIQHSSAGDVLITTGCFKGIMEKHSNREMDYMTSKQFSDILVGNGYISEILEWDKELMAQYKQVYWPHERIRTGNWGTQDIPLWAMHSLLCDVDFDKMYIEQKEIDNPSIKGMISGGKYITLNNQGGHPYRFYPWMSDIISMVKGVSFIQIGGKDDAPIEGAINLAGKLSYRESAYVVKNGIFHIGVDSFCSHLAAAVDKLQICIYGSGARRVTKPKGLTVDIQPNYILTCPILGPCWGNRAGCDAPCIKSLSPKSIYPVVNLMLEGFDRGLSNDKVLDEVKASFNG